MFKCKCCPYRPPPVTIPECKTPLKTVSFNATVQNSLVNLSIFQTFTNDEEKPVQCECMFSVSDDSAISNLRINLTDGKILTSRVEPADKAIETYQDSIAEGNTVALGKMDEDDKLTIFIGNLARRIQSESSLILYFPCQQMSHSGNYQYQQVSCQLQTSIPYYPSIFQYK